MKNEFNKHGRRLTDREYEKKTVDFYTSFYASHPHPSKEDDAQYRKGELNIMIDYKLGVDFPADRREEMWQAAEKVEKGRIRMAFSIIASYFKKGKFTEKHMDGSKADAGILSRMVQTKYGSVLDDEEMNQFLGSPEDRVLPPNTWRKPEP